MPRKRRRTDIDPQHGAEPQIFADALVHQVLVHAAASWIGPVWSNWKVFVPELAPDTQDLYPLGLVSVDQKVISHVRTMISRMTAAGAHLMELSAKPRRRARSTGRIDRSKSSAAQDCEPLHPG